MEILVHFTLCFSSSLSKFLLLWINKRIMSFWIYNIWDLICMEWMITSISIRTPDQLCLQSIWIIGCNKLLVPPFLSIGIVKVPLSRTFGFVVLELSLKISAIWVHPTSTYEVAFKPLSNILHGCGIEYVGSLSMFFTILPLPWVNILIWVDKHSFTLFAALIPLAIVLWLIGVV